MHLSEEAEKKLRNWLSIDTWHTSDDSDMDRFYDFVDAYERDHGSRIDEPALQKYIEDQLGSLSQPLHEIVRARISLARSILDFLKCTGR